MLRCSATRATTRTLHEPWPKPKRPPSARDPPSQSAAPQKTAESISRKPYDFIIYVDESGDHSLESIDPEYPLFVLAFCIFRKADYVRTAVPSVQDLKFNWFGHDLVILHENEIVKRKPPFSFLQYDNLRARFMGDLNAIVANAPM